MAPASSRRISYVVPPPSNAVQKLRLPPEGTPRNGQTGPILLSSNNSESEKLSSNGVLGKKSRYPRHRLGVAAFALDSSTRFVGRDSPEGFLYTGGRDGMIMAWDLGLPMKPRTPRFSASVQNGGLRRMGRWERLTIDEDDDTAIYEEEDDEWRTSDGDVIGDVLGSSGRRGSRYWTKQNDLPYERRWEIDVNHVGPGQPAYWRKHVQAHTDWVNDMLLCNLNQTVISGSSDGTVKAWNPHSSVPTPPSTIGTHSDYVRCLTQCQERKWIASGSFDRTIKLWDMSQPRTDPLVTLNPPESAGPKSSVYALATDSFGQVVAAGGPERVVRTWDPRSGKGTGKLVGHTDNIRAILMSEDSRYLLTGSADASIKLWSLLSPQRCIYTFTYHTESVWSLFSSHPSLEVFYSGDRSGILCRVDVEECQRVAQGECIALCKDTGEPSMASSEGINKIIAMDDHLVWTASGSSSIRRWRVPQGRVARAMTSNSNSLDEQRGGPAHSQRSLRRHASMPSTPRLSSSPPEDPPSIRLRGESLVPSIYASSASQESMDVEGEEITLNGIPYDSLIKLSAPNAHHATFTFASRGREAEVSTIYSVASTKSVPRKPRSPSAGAFSVQAYGYSQGHNNLSAPGRRDTLSPPVQDAPSQPFPLPSPRMAYEDRDVAPDATPLVSEPDLVIEGEHGFVRATIMNDRMHALTVDTAGVVAVWDIVRCQCLGVFSKEDVRNAYTSSSCTSSSNAGTRTSTASSANTNANSGDTAASGMKPVSPRQALEIVRDRIEGEAVVNQWSNADTRIGELAINVLDRCFESEVFADEVGYRERTYPDDHRLNIGKWVLRNLFMGFIKEEQRLTSKNAHEKNVPSSYRAQTHAQVHGHSSWQRGHDPSAGHTHGHVHGHSRSSSESAVGGHIPGPLNTSDLPPADLPAGTAWSTRVQGNAPLSPIAQSPEGSAAGDTLATPKPGTFVRAGTSARAATSGASEGASGASATTAPPHVVPPTPPTSSTSHDYFSLRRRPSTAHSTSTVTATGEDDFSGWGGPGSSKSSSTHEGAPSTPSTPGGGFMGKLKSFGKSARRAATEFEMTSSSVVHSTTESHESKAEEQTRCPSPPKTLIAKLKSQPLTPPSSHDGPTLQIPSETAILISEELACGWSPVYRGTVGNVGVDVPILEELLPDWLLEFLLANKVPSFPTAKISFVLFPAAIPAEMRDVYGETLPELLNTAQSKLAANRFLRVRKLCYHVQDKLDKNLTSKQSSPRSSSDALSLGRISVSMSHKSDNQSRSQSPNHTPASPNSPPSSRASTPRLSPNMQQLHGHGGLGMTSLSNSSPFVGPLPRAEEVYEILCNDQVLSNEMTLAAVRQFVWRQSGELVMHYRRKARRDRSSYGGSVTGIGTGGGGTPRSTEQSSASLPGSSSSSGRDS